MSARRPSPARPAGRIPLARLVAGILLHFCVPAYLLASLFAGVAVAPAVTSLADILPRMLWTGAWFLPAYLLLTGLAAAGAALLERRAPPPVRDEAALSRGRLGEAGRTLAALGDRRVAAALARIDATLWDHGDPRDQQVTADLEAAARTFAAAAMSADPARRADVLTLAADSIERLAAAAGALAEDRARLDEGDARTVAGYLATRYRQNQS